MQCYINEAAFNHFPILVSPDCDWRSRANLRTINRILVGTERAASNRLLEHVNSVPHPDGAARDVLHPMAQRKKVRTRGNR